MDLRLDGAQRAILLDGRPVETEVSLFSAEGFRRCEADSVHEVSSGSFRESTMIRNDTTTFRIQDSWERTETGARLVRSIEAAGDAAAIGAGLNARIILSLGPGTWKFFIPSACYDYCPNEQDPGCTLVSEERTAAPLVMAYDAGSGRAIALLRETPAHWSRPRERNPGQTRFIHASEIGGLGYFRRAPRGPALLACLPCAEGPSSRMLGKSLDGFTAFLPAAAAAAGITISYRVLEFQGPTFDQACFHAWCLAWKAYDPQPHQLDLDLLACVRARTACLAGLLRSWNGHTGLALNFDPKAGVDSPPSGYGTGFNTLASAIFPGVLEYGFTGRQLNNAFMLHVLGTESGRSEWTVAALRITQSFLRACPAPSGFLHTLYDVKRHQAISPFGDPVGAQLHYGVPDAPGGNYVRNMAEAGCDLCLLSKRLQAPEVRKVAAGLGRFLLAVQNKDGSWHRAYTMTGQPIRAPEEWFGGSARATRSSTSTVIPFLLALHALTEDRQYRDSALRAGHWLLEEVVQNADYRGGTLDNPNVVDKEGMAYPMAALVGLYEATRDRDFLAGAVRAGGMMLTWNCLWDVPFEEGTRLQRESFLSRGWGGISILWGAGVVDNYSLWFAPTLCALAEHSGERIFDDAARLVLFGTQQLLSLPGSMHGLMGEGMQEEGFALSDQGIDDGLIRKGDTWGALGWVLAAGTYPVLSMLRKTGESFR